MEFMLNDFKWQIRRVDSYSDLLRRSDGSLTVGMTDRDTQMIYLSEDLQGEFLRKVLCHEICHSAMFSYSIDMSIEQEELFCDLMATYGSEIINITDGIFKVLRKRVA